MAPAEVQRKWARSKPSPGRSFGVGEELAIEGVGDPALQAAHRFERFLPAARLRR